MPNGQILINGHLVYSDTVTTACIRYPAFDKAEPYELWGEMCQPHWLTYGSMSFPTLESAQRELDNIRRTHLLRYSTDPDKYKHWRAEERQVHLLVTPINPFKDEKTDEEE